MKGLSIFFITLFTLFIVTPTVVTLIKNTVDISYVYSISEEEQNNEERKLGEKPTKILSKFLSISLGFIEFPKKNFSDFYFDNWSTVYFDLNSPPPEYI